MLQHHSALPPTSYSIWLSRHQWALIQKGESDTLVERPLDERRSVVAVLASDAAGAPHVQQAWFQIRTLFGYRRRAALPTDAHVQVRLSDD